MESVVLAGLTVKQLLIYGGIGVGVIVLLSLVKRMFHKEKPSTLHQMARCPGCSWAGKISRHNPRCPRCNKPIPISGK